MSPENKVHKIIYLTDRSAAETDDQCGMKFWLNRKCGGKGIVPKKEEFALLIGRETHEDLATVAELKDISPDAIQALIDPILAPLTEDDRKDTAKMEILYRRLGWLAAFALYIEPSIRAQYETIAIEKEICLDRDPLWVGVTPDRVLRSRANPKLIIYKEYKTTISASNKWINSWLYQIQLHLGIAAVSEELKERVGFAQIMGLMKGSTGWGEEQGKLSHPYVWAWYNHQLDKWSCSYESARGHDWIRMPVWEYPGGVVKWVQFCGAEIAQAQFPHSPPVFLNQMMLDDWIARRTHRERHIRNVEGVCKTNRFLRQIHFEKRTRCCRPAFGDPCSYLPVCWNATVEADPLSSPDYIERTPHHDLEIIGVE